MRKLFLGTAALCLFALSASADDGIPDDTLKTLKAATVLVRVQSGNTLGLGAGFLIKVDGESGLFVTNHHVVAFAGKEVGKNIKVTLVFNAGAKGERSVAAEVVASDYARNIAFLKVEKVSDLPAPLDITQKVEPRETMTIYSVGFPVEKGSSPTKPNPPMTVSKGNVSGIRLDESKEIAEIVLQGELSAGGSGGPIVDEKGRLVGVAVGKLRGPRLLSALPPDHLGRMLHGQVGIIGLTTTAADPGKVEVKITAPLIDPLRKLQKVEIYYVRAEQLAERPKPNDKGVWAVLPKSEKVNLTLDQGKGTASLEMKVDTRRKLEYLVQAVYTDGAGKTLYTQPVSHVIDFTIAKMIDKEPISRPGAPEKEVVSIGEATVTETKLPTKGVPPCLCWSKDGKAFFHLDGDNGILRRIDLVSLNADKPVDLGWKCSWLSMSKEGLLVTVYDAQEVWLLDETTLKVKHKFEQGGVKWAVSGPMSSIAVGVDHKGDTLAVFDLVTGKTVKEYETKSFVSGGTCSMGSPAMTPNGKYLFTLDRTGYFHRFKINGNELELEETSQRVVVDSRHGIAVSDDYVCVPWSRGSSRTIKDHPELVGNGTYVYWTDTFSKPAFTLTQGNWALAVEFDRKAKLVYSNNMDHNLIVFSGTGRKLKELKLGPGKPRQFLSHPEGYRVVVLTDERLYVVVLGKE